MKNQSFYFYAASLICGGIVLMGNPWFLVPQAVLVGFQIYVVYGEIKEYRGSK